MKVPVPSRRRDDVENTGEISKRLHIRAGALRYDPTWWSLNFSRAPRLEGWAVQPRVLVVHVQYLYRYGNTVVQ